MKQNSGEVDFATFIAKPLLNGAWREKTACQRRQRTLLVLAPA